MGGGVVILGAHGMLGHALQRAFPGARCFGHDLDITDAMQVTRTLTGIGPDLVINAAAYTDVDGCETRVDHAMAVNGDGPGIIARACAQTGATMVHYSTDYVFDGERGDYIESDPPHPISVYGESKLRGEQMIAEEMEDFRIIRTQWLYGRHGRNFVETILSLSPRSSQVRVVSDQRGRPTYTDDLAQMTQTIASMEPGIYHVTNDGTCSWYEFASAFIPNAVPCTTEEFPRPAKRPRAAVLISTRTSPMRPWKEALAEYLSVRVEVSKQ